MRHIDPQSRGFDWRTVFADGSVQGQTAFAQAMGLAGPPCHWTSDILDDATFFGHWRGWIEAAPEDFYPSWGTASPADWQEVAPIPPPAGCVWATTPQAVAALRGSR
uniref:Uncharacterized protein n=1 Tax=Yoonia rhodophyticola TaxID=3137370 RepID=A0AAN0MDU5_9RHOB